MTKMQRRNLANIAIFDQAHAYMTERIAEMKSDKIMSLIEESKDRLKRSREGIQNAKTKANADWWKTRHMWAELAAYGLAVLTRDWVKERTLNAEEAQ